MSDQGNHHLSHGKNWGALPVEGASLHWSMEDGGPMVQGPFELKEHRGRRMLLHLEPGQYGLLVTEEQLRAVYLEGGHHLEIGNGPQQVPVDGSLILLSSDEPMPFRFAGDCALKAPDGTGIIARGTLRLQKPARFYHRILRQAGRDWSSDSLLAVLTPVVREAFQDLLESCLEDTCGDTGTLQSALMTLDPSRLDEFLAPAGLYCASVAAYTDTPPVEDCADPASLLSEEFLHT